MSRKYLYFKLFRDLNDNIESETLSEYEITSYLDDVDIIQNVFQLYQNTELRLLINKSRQLQNLLTKSLPRHGYRHGYLWSGDQFPDFTEILSSCGLIEECIAFQKTTDMLPVFKSNAIFQMKRRLEVYNWFVYHLQSFQFYFEKSSKIHSTGESEVDIDWSFDSLWEKQKEIEHVDDAPVFETDEPAGNQQTLNYISHDKRAYAKSRNLRWIRPILKYINSNKDGLLYIPFSGNGNILIEGLFSGNRMIVSEINPVRYRYLSGCSQVYDINLIQLSQAISDIISQIKVLTTGTYEMQVDLFVNSTEKEFQEFWQSENERIKIVQNNKLPDNFIKIIAAIRFLIDSRYVSKSKSINNFLMSGLINLTACLLRRKSINNIIDLYQKELRRLYLDTYIFHKIKQLNQTPGSVDQVIMQNALDTKSIKKDSIDSICCFFPSNINKKGFKDDQAIIDILNLSSNSPSLGKYALGLKKGSLDDGQKWDDEIIHNGDLFSILGTYGQNILTRMHTHNRPSEAAQFLKLWINGYYFLLECSRILQAGCKACLILKNPSLKILEEFEEMKTIEVFKELIIKHAETMRFNIIESFCKSRQQIHFGKIDYYHILLFEKSK